MHTAQVFGDYIDVHDIQQAVEDGAIVPIYYESRLAKIRLSDEGRELAVALFEQVRANATIDWAIKASVRAKLKVMIKRTLRKYGYPPDIQKLATETVLEQAGLIADQLTRSEI